VSADLPRLSAIGRDVSRLLTSLARTSRSRHLYAANNEVLRLMKTELRRAVEDVFRQVPEIEITVRPEALSYADEDVFVEAPDAVDSLPFLLYRDGIRRLVLQRGLTDAELEQLVDAINQGQSGRSLEDDIVVHLWRHGFEHLRYVTVDVHVADASADVAMEQQVDAVLRSLYTNVADGESFQSISIDAQEEAAKAIADAMGDPDALALGFHPSGTLASLPAYAGRLLGSIDDEHVFWHFVDETAEVLLAHPDEAEPIFATYLSIFDGAVVDGDLALARHVVSTVRELPVTPAVEAWLGEAISDGRLRQVTQMVQSNPQLESDAIEFFRSTGSGAIPSLIRSLPGLTQPEVRRRFADLVLDLGDADEMLVRELVSNEQGFAAREGLYLLARTDRLRDRSFLREIQCHPSPQVRLTLIQEIDRVPQDVASWVLAEMLRDPTARVRVAAIETLAQRGDDVAARALLQAVEQPEFDDESETVKRALLFAVASVLGAEAVTHMEPMIARVDAWMPRTSHEESARAAVYALGQLRHPASVDVLKRASTVKCRSVRTDARRTLERLRGDEP
jgi:HEAT repeat protein